MILVLPLLRRKEIVRIDVFQPDEDARDTGAFRFSNEVWDFMAQRVDLNQETNVHAVSFAQLDDAIKNQLPVFVAREIIVGNEKPKACMWGHSTHQIATFPRRAATTPCPYRKTGHTKQPPITI